MRYYALLDGGCEPLGQHDDFASADAVKPDAQWLFLEYGLKAFVSQAMNAMIPALSGAGEVVVPLNRNRNLVVPAHPHECDYVTITDAVGNEVLHWVSSEWQEEPEQVVGAIVGAVIACLKGEQVQSGVGQKGQVEVSTNGKIGAVEEGGFWNLGAAHWDGGEGQAGEDGAAWRWLGIEDADGYSTALVQVDEGDPDQERNGRMIWKAPELVYSLKLMVQLAEAMGLSDVVPIVAGAQALLRFIDDGDLDNDELLPEEVARLHEETHGLVYKVNGKEIGRGSR